MLSNFLPGLREVRAPLTAGYVWLIGAWLLFHDSFPTTQAEAHGGPWEPFFRLGGVVSSFGLALVLSVLAYLIGSLSEGIFRRLIEGWAGHLGGGPSSEVSWKGDESLVLLGEDRIRRVSEQLADESLSLRDLPEYAEEAVKVEQGFDYLNRLGFVYLGVNPFILYPGVGPLGEEGPSEFLKERKRRSGPIGLIATWTVNTHKGWDLARREELAKADWHVFVELGLRWNIVPTPFLDYLQDLQHMGSFTPEQIKEFKQMGSYTPEQIKRAQSRRKETIIKELLAHHLVERISTQIGEEMPLVATRLLGAENDLFHEFDRQRGESNFRFAIIPPLLFLTVALALEVHLAFFMVLVSAPLFYWQGVRYRQEASDVLIDSLVVGRVEAPAIEKFERAANRALAIKKQLASRGRNSTES